MSLANLVTSPAAAGEKKFVVEGDEEAGEGPGIAAPDQQVENFRQTRLARKNEVAEDYVELIAELIDNEGEARTADIARRMGVSHATVTKTVARLQRDGLVVSKPYRAIFLSPEGRQLAAWSKRRHEIVVQFLRAIGVGEASAQADAEGIEHHVSAETLAAFERLMGTLGKSVD